MISKHVKRQSSWKKYFLDYKTNIVVKIMYHVHTIITVHSFTKYHVIVWSTRPIVFAEYHVTTPDLTIIVFIQKIIVRIFLPWVQFALISPSLVFGADVRRGRVGESVAGRSTDEKRKHPGSALITPLSTFVAIILCRLARIWRGTRAVCNPLVPESFARLKHLLQVLKD